MLKLTDTLKRIGETISPRQLLVKRMIIAIFTFFITLIFMFYLHEVNKQNISTKVNNAESLTIAINSKQVDLMKQRILFYVEKYKDAKEPVTQELIFDEMASDGTFYNTKINEVMAEEAVKKIEQYKNEYFRYYEFIICLLAAIVAFYMPYWMVLYKKKILKMSMEDEVNQFNSIIYMMMYIDHVTVKDILEQLELFSVVFKQSIQECINEYNSGDIEALERMKAKEKFGPFCRMVDNLIRCDIISIDKAFDEIASDRENYHDRRKQDNEISIQKRANIAKPLAFVPTVLVLIYLTLPLVMAGIKELRVFQDMINNI